MVTKKAFRRESLSIFVCNLAFQQAPVGVTPRGLGRARIKRPVSSCSWSLLCSPALPVQQGVSVNLPNTPTDAVVHETPPWYCRSSCARAHRASDPRYDAPPKAVKPRSTIDANFVPYAISGNPSPVAGSIIEYDHGGRAMAHPLATHPDASGLPAPRGYPLLRAFRIIHPFPTLLNVAATAASRSSPLVARPARACSSGCSS